MFVPVRDIEVWAEVHGPADGAPLLVISGTGADLRSDVDRNGQRVTHPAVRAGFRVIRFDQRGLGQTSKPPGPYSMEGYADDAAALVTHLSGEGMISDEPIGVVGISFGGMVAQHVAIRHPDRIAALVLCCTSSGGAGGSSFDLLALEGVPEPNRCNTLAALSDTRNQPTAIPPVYAPGVKGAAVRGSIAAAFRASDPEAMRAYLTQLEARAHHNTWDLLPSVAVPTLVCGGVYDAQALPVNHRRLAARLPNAKLEMFQGGHGFLYQDGDAWPSILRFLTERMGPTANETRS